MPVLLDTGVLVAAVNADDARHDAANALLQTATSGRHGTPLALDHVLEEGLTFLRARKAPPAASKAYAALFWHPEVGLFEWRTTERPVLQEATDLYFQHAKRGLSMTDCVILAHATRMGASVATFDSGFKGLVDVLE